MSPCMVCPEPYPWAPEAPAKARVTVNIMIKSQSHLFI
jgi:hypothetical protein